MNPTMISKAVRRNAACLVVEDVRFLIVAQGNLLLSRRYLRPLG